MKVKSNKIGDVYRFYWQRLSKVKKTDEAKFLVSWLIEEYCLIKKSDLLLNPDKPISESLLLKIHFAVEELEQNKPIQYILNKTEFAGLNFYVNENVLIPRPETEEMVMKIVEENKDKFKCKILDICTGSACIAVSLAYLLKAKVSATDFSESALEIAKRNAESNFQSIDFYQFDVLDLKKWPSFSATFDIIVSNPPYVCESEKPLMAENVLNFEPEMALFVPDNDPLKFYKAIFNKLDELLKKDGIFYAEINENFGNELIALAHSFDFKAIIINDFRLKARVLKAWKA